MNKLKTVYGNIWDFSDRGAIGIPTNGVVNAAGAAVMGAGLALDAKVEFRGIEIELGKHLTENGNVCGVFKKTGLTIVTIPTKPVSKRIAKKREIVPYSRHKFDVGDVVPGYYCYADPDLIARSIGQLPSLLRDHKIGNLFIPMIGCGFGELNFDTDVLPILESQPDEFYQLVTLVVK